MPAPEVTVRSLAGSVFADEGVRRLIDTARRQAARKARSIPGRAFISSSAPSLGAKKPRQAIRSRQLADLCHRQASRLRQSTLTVIHRAPTRRLLIVTRSLMIARAVGWRVSSRGEQNFSSAAGSPPSGDHAAPSGRNPFSPTRERSRRAPGQFLWLRVALVRSWCTALR